MVLYTGKISNVELVSADMGWDAYFPYKGEMQGNGMKRILLKAVFPAKENNTLSL